MRKPRPTLAADGGALARALAAVLDRETDPRARAWLRGLIEGDKPAKRAKRPRRKPAAA